MRFCLAYPPVTSFGFISLFLKSPVRFRNTVLTPLPYFFAVDSSVNITKGKTTEHFLVFLLKFQGRDKHCSNYPSNHGIEVVLEYR